MVESIVGEEDADARAMVAEKCGVRELPPGARIIAFRDKHGVRGVFLFERYTGVNGSIHAHWAGRDPMWLKGYMLTLVFMYAFDQLGCRKIFGEVKAKDARVRRIDEKLGFREVARLEGYFPEDDLIVYELNKQDCVFLPDEFKEHPTYEVAE